MQYINRIDLQLLDAVVRLLFERTIILDIGHLQACSAGWCLQLGQGSGPELQELA